MCALAYDRFTNLYFLFKKLYAKNKYLREKTQ